MPKYFIFLIIIFNACQSPDGKSTQIAVENSQLKVEISDLREKLRDLSTKLEGQEVSLSNTESRRLKSNIIGRDFEIKVALPKGYASNSEKKYPVLYVIDAETNFGGVSYIVKRLIKDELIPQIIVVGIAYDTTYEGFYELRSRDLTPYEDKKLKMGGRVVKGTGGADKFADFIEDELFPYISSNYNVDTADRGIYGHSFGGLFGSHLILKRTNLFSRYLLLGSSLWYMDAILVDEASKAELEFERRTRVYMGSGDLDLRIDVLQEEFAKELKSKNYLMLNVKSEVLENETHRTIFGPGFTNGLRFIYEDD